MNEEIKAILIGIGVGLVLIGIALGVSLLF